MMEGPNLMVDDLMEKINLNTDIYMDENINMHRHRG